MLQPQELKLDLPMELSNGVISTTPKVWEILYYSRKGNLEAVKKMVAECPELIFAQYNYTPPIHFAVREGHIALVKYLLENGAHDPAYKSYPFLDSLDIIAEDRGYKEIFCLLKAYAENSALQKFKGDNGKIFFERTELQLEFENAVDKGGHTRTVQLLESNPELAKDDSFFWGEGILMMPAKAGDFKMIELLLKHGAKFPNISKWSQFYYFERYDCTAYILENGMSPNHMSWQQVTILHDMAQKGDIPKAELLIKHGADIEALEEEYSSTPLGLAARWGQLEMVKFLLKQGANPNKSGAEWATPMAWTKKKGQSEIERILLKAGAR